jgi:hypothetical protein
MARRFGRNRATRIPQFQTRFLRDTVGVGAGILQGRKHDRLIERTVTVSANLASGEGMIGPVCLPQLRSKPLGPGMAN